ncbi:hypothetical protein [Mesorhizobium sp. M1E.F.Ca.ET.063.01.1.1]|uniref:hypothetical protein n=1 Tax=Mesorhizobium sp. M1E.F.Ca.ET.063.01.1.1 TaxID=2496750 RepID=UPI000FCA1E14|nr:hypothetical protein [Mesorhizobium sp. M1E.F.Ca.ET.063.01.1.1]RUW84894.1 hypothetical protein EOA29_07390 [Mesorhizobium sp. M1E.F.Ca.ET.063.01.1.1]
MSAIRIEKASIFKHSDGFNSLPLKDCVAGDANALALPTLNNQNYTICSNAGRQRKIRLKHFRFRHAIAKESAHALRRF